jgi:hypothetical protein
MPRLVIKTAGHKVYGRAMKAGDEFECTEGEAAVWRKMGWASDAQSSEPKASEAQPRSHRGRYSRADLRAEDQE